MLFDFEGMTPAQCFEFLTGTVVPRPIALVTSLSPTGLVNAAPYSFFNIMGIEPPVVAFAVLPGADGRMKDTGRNIKASREFVVNLVSDPMAEAMNITCIDAPADVEELTLAGLKTAPSTKVRTPRVEASPVALECVLHAEVPLTANQFIAIGRIVRAHVADQFVMDAAKQSLRHACVTIDRRHACREVVFADIRELRDGPPDMGGLDQARKALSLLGTRS